MDIFQFAYLYINRIPYNFKKELYISKRQKSQQKVFFRIPLTFAIAKALSRSNTKESLWRHCSNKILISLQITSTEHRIMYLTVPN